MDFKDFDLGKVKVDVSKFKPDVDFPKLRTASFSSEEIKAMTDEDIKAILTGEKEIDGVLPITLQIALSNELTTRAIKKASKPHWSLPYGFAVAVIAMVAACVAAYPIIFPPRSSQSSTEVQKSDLPAQSVQRPVSSSHKQSQNLQPKLQSRQQK